MSVAEQLAKGIALYPGDCIEVMRGLADNSIDSVATDPPYHLTSIVKRFSDMGPNDKKLTMGRINPFQRTAVGFMNQKWDGGDIAFQVETWREVYRVLKPGAHLVAFGATRNYHRMACAIEDAGFEIRDSLMWLFGTGFPKSHDVSKGIDRAAGAEREKVRVDASDLKNPNLVGGAVKGEDRPWRLAAMERGYHEVADDTPATPEAAEWEGWGTALKPAVEPIVLARKPLSEGTVAANVLRWRTGALNIDVCRVGTEGGTSGSNYAKTGLFGIGGKGDIAQLDAGRWPANICHDGSEEVVGAFPDTPASSDRPRHNGEFKSIAKGYDYAHTTFGHADAGGSAARFFYSAKADSDDRLGSKHPTVKPVDLMQWLVRLITPKGGVVLDLFAGTGTTGEAALREGMQAILIEQNPEYQDDIRRRMRLAMSGPDERARESIKAKLKDKPVDHGPLFAETFDYKPRDDFAKSIDACYEAVRERVAKGGPTWTPKTPKTSEAAE